MRKHERLFAYVLIPVAVRLSDDSLIKLCLIKKQKTAHTNKEIDDCFNIQPHGVAANNVRLDSTKPFLGVSDKARLKPVSSATETS